jgi:hypothetical protein
VTIRETPRRTPQGHGPFGPISRTLCWIQPVTPITSVGRARILANLERIRAKQFCLSSMVLTGSMQLIVAGTYEREKVTPVQVLPVSAHEMSLIVTEFLREFKEWRETKTGLGLCTKGERQDKAGSAHSSPRFAPLSQLTAYKDPNSGRSFKAITLPLTRPLRFSSPDCGFAGKV